MPYRMQRSTLVSLICVSSAGALIGFAWPGNTPSQTTTNVRFSICHTGGGTNCVVDGDTAWIDGTKVRLADIDAPETHKPRCSREAELGARSTIRLVELMNDSPFTQVSIDRDADRFGRKLRILTRNGRSLGDELVEEGLARPYAGGRRPWC